MMNRKAHFVAFSAGRVSAHLLIGLAVPATVFALLVGYQRPSNAAIVAFLTAPDATSASADGADERLRWKVF